MHLNEMWERQPQGYQDLSQDNSVPKLESLRKTRLTLKQIKKLRKMNDIRNIEHREKLAQVRKMYQPPAEPAA